MKLPHRRTDASTTASAAQGDGDSGTDGDTAAAFVAKFVDAVELVQSKTTGPLIVAVRGLVYGLVIAVAAVTMVVLLAVMFIRLLDVALPRSVWLAHAVGSVVFGALGAWAWSRGRPKEAS